MRMDNFFRIRAEKQNHIIDAAFAVFGKQGYRKTSLSDIAKEAGTTKTMITYYFGSKKTLYMYLVDISQSLLDRVANKRMANRNADFFERLRTAAEVNISAIEEHPALFNFANSLYIESDPEVAADIAKRVTSLEYTQTEFFMEGVGASKFKSEFDPDVLCRFMVWALDGFMSEICERRDTKIHADALASQFYDCLDVMQKTFTESPV